MTRHTFAIVCALLMTLVIADAAQAVYHPTLGRFAQRDPNGTALSPEHRPGAAPAANGGFAQRDPMRQYADGMNLYLYQRARPNDSVDPTGLVRASVQFGGFISGRLGDWLPEPVPGSPWEFETNKRGFGGGSYKVAGYIFFDTDDLGSITTANSQAFLHSHTSQRRRPKPGGGYVYEHAQERPLGAIGFKNTGPNETTWTVAGQGKYPFAPNITYALAAVDFHVHIRVKCIQPTLVEVEITGWHDAFPDYESLWRSEGTPFSLLYGYESPAPGPTPAPSSLGPGGNVQVDVHEVFQLGS